MKEEIWSKCEGIMKYVRNMKIRTLPIYGPWDLEKISSSSSYFGAGAGRWFAIPRFRGTPEKRHETCQFRAFQQKGGEEILRGRGHNSWNGPQYRKGRRVSRQKIRTISSMDMRHVSIAGTWKGITSRSQSLGGSSEFFQVSGPIWRRGSRVRRNRIFSRNLRLISQPI